MQAKRWESANLNRMLSPDFADDSSAASSSMSGDNLSPIFDEISDVRLRFQRRARGATLWAFGVGDDGTMTIAVPDDLEARTLHIAQLGGQGHKRTNDTYNVETLRRIAGGQSGARRCAVGARLPKPQSANRRCGR